jgi:hypothetical protein
MKTIRIARDRFDLPRFLAAFETYFGKDAFGIIVEDDGILFYCEWDADEDLPDEPLKCLEAGRTLFAMFTAHDDDGFDCVDGTKITLPDLDGDFDVENDEQVEPHAATPEEHERVENTNHDDCRGYGYTIALKADTLHINAAIWCDITSECNLEEVQEPNLLDQPMATFVLSFARKRRAAKRGDRSK